MEEQINKDYLKGFNEGYVMAAYEGQAANKIAEIESHQPRLAGFRDGYPELTLEAVRENIPGWMRPSSASSPGTPQKDNDKSPDMDI